MWKFVSIAVLLGLAGSAPAAAPSASHPLLGIWVLTLPDGSCSETYRYRGDGTTLVTSAEEISESEFVVAAEPSVNGFYKIDEKVVRDNGKKDCAGAVTKVGTRISRFLLFHPQKTQFLMCRDETLNECIGPFVRKEGLET
jgi:hypothetical protein